MAEIKLCPECNAPEEITKNYVWLNNGVMVQSGNMSRRVGFIESENLDPLYMGIGEIMGQPIDQLVIDVARRGTLDYFGNIIPEEVKGVARTANIGMGFLAEFMITMGQLNGFGKYEVMEVSYHGDENDHTTVRISEPFSLLLCAGTLAGGCEVLAGRPHGVSYHEISSGVYEITARVTEDIGETGKGLSIKEYHHRDGDIELKKCGTCGGPASLSGFKWVLDRGMIINTWTGRRMAMMGPEVQDPLFEELERELGETVPQAVIEAQRRFIMTGFYSIDEVSDEGDFRTQLALRGMGNLRELSIGEKGMLMRIDNAANYLMTVGLAQGLFEMAFGIDSTVEWAVSQNGDLEVEVIPKR